MVRGVIFFVENTEGYNRNQEDPRNKYNKLNKNFSPNMKL